MTTDDVSQRRDVPAEASKNANDGLPGLDRTELLKSPAGRPESTAPVGNEGTTAAPSLKLTDGDQLPVVRQSDKFDPSKPTALFLDDFSPVKRHPGEISHGDISLKAAENAGYNVIGLEAKKGMGYGDALSEIDRRVAAGELNLGKGDVINVSMGNLDQTFAQASKELGFEVNAGNLAEMRPKIIERMRELSNDPSQPAEVRERNGQAVKANDAIARLQERGIEVLHAAGNDGPERFSPEFLNAKHQFASVKPSGKPVEDTAFHSLTEGGNGRIPVVYKPDVDLLSATPLSKQVGMLEYGDTGVRVPASVEEAKRGNDEIFNPEAFVGKYAKPKVLPDFSKADALVFAPESGAATKFDTSLPAEPPGSKVEMLSKYSVSINGASQPWQRAVEPGEVAVTGVVEGTSFVNIGYLRDNFRRLQQLKN